MFNIGQILTFIKSLGLKQSQGQNQARLAFYNYLLLFHENSEPLTPLVIDSFYDRCLTQAFWQSQKIELSNTIRSDLEAMSKKGLLPFSLEKIVHADEMQWLQLENSSDFESLLSIEQAALENKNEIVKVALLGNKDVLRMRLLPNYKLIVETKSKTAFLDQGQLHLLRPVTRLSYDSNYELSANTLQILELAERRLALFKTAGQRISGFIIDSLNFSIVENLAGLAQDHWKFLQALKNLESHYIKRETDGEYSSIASHLKNAIYDLKTSPQPDRPRAQIVLNKGDLALKNLFPNDSNLSLLVSTLRRLMTTQGTKNSWKRNPEAHL